MAHAPRPVHAVSTYDPSDSLDDRVEAIAVMFEALTGKVANRDEIRAGLLEGEAERDQGN